MIAEIGTPAGLLNSGEMHGQFSAGAVNLEFGCARVLFSAEPMAAKRWEFSGVMAC